MDSWFLLAVMSLAVFRLTRLVVEDDFPPVLWLRLKVAGGWRPATPDEIRDRKERPFNPLEEIDGVLHRYVLRARWSPKWLASLVSCSWCASGWIAAAVTGVTCQVGDVPLPVLVWLAVWGAGSLIAAQGWA